MIPAWAGESGIGVLLAMMGAADPRVGGAPCVYWISGEGSVDNPRVGGGAVSALACPVGWGGRSPRGRGNPATVWGVAGMAGTIPAWAGESFACTTLHGWSLGVIPRACGCFRLGLCGGRCSVEFRVASGVRGAREV